MYDETVGDWMYDWEKEFRIKNRIACEEKGYPASEALYPSISAWEAATGKDWFDFVAENA